MLINTFKIAQPHSHFYFPRLETPRPSLQGEGLNDSNSVRVIFGVRLKNKKLTGKQ